MWTFYPLPEKREPEFLGVRLVPKSSLLWGGGQFLQPQPEPEMWVFNYTIKCTIRHNYQCLEPETAHNRRVIYCSLCLYYAVRSLMMLRCLHTAPLPWRRACRHLAKLTNGSVVPDPWMVSTASAANLEAEGQARQVRMG